MIVNIVFYVFAAVLVVAALGVITARNPVHCALFLVFAFFNSAVIWLLLEAEFLAITLLVVYVGAVMVLWLFVVMMLDVDVTRLREGFTRYAPLGALVALIVIAQIGLVVYVRGLGLMLGVEFDTPEHAEEVQWACFERGLLVLECGKSSVRMSPPLTVTEAEMTTALRLFGEAVAAVAGDAAGVLAEVEDAGALHEVEAAG